MKVAVLGNPTTQTSSAAFLRKFCRLVGPLSTGTYVVNDGAVPGSELNAAVIPSTRILFRPGSRARFVVGIANFLLAQCLLSVGLLKCVRKVDIVFTFPITMVLPALVSKLAGKRLTLYEAQDITDQSFARDIPGRFRYMAMLMCRSCVLHLADFIIVEGQGVLEQNRISDYRNKVVVCPQFVDHTRFYIKVPVQERPLRVGFVGTLDARKGAIEFAKGIQRLASVDDLTFLMVGSGPLKSAIESLLQDLCELKRVELREFVPDQEMPDFFNGLALCVMPSVSEGLPNTLLEAMACGTPVLATAVGAIADIIEDGRTGFLMHERSPETIAANIVRALDSPEYESISRNARDFIEKSYTYVLAAERYRRMFSLFGPKQEQTERSARPE